MRLNKTAEKVLSVILITAFCFTLFSVGTSAISLDTKGSITLHVADSKNKIPMEGASFRLYFFAAAHKKENGVGYYYVVPYNDCNMDMNDLQDSYLAVHLSHFALTHDLPYTEKTSDSKGNIVFENLEPGVYLILATDIVEGYFLPAPFVINIPVYDHEDKSWEYDINATPKMQLSGNSLGETTYLSVKKAWKTDEKLPEKVTVSLLCDLREVERVELSEKNNWYYRWDLLDKSHTWNVVESVVPDGYKVSYDFSANAVTITNTKEGYKEQTTTKPDELIDTGQLNWPVPVFSVVGLLLFSVGWAMLNLSKKDEETA